MNGGKVMDGRGKLKAGDAEMGRVVEIWALCGGMLMAEAGWGRKQGMRRVAVVLQEGFQQGRPWAGGNGNVRPFAQAPQRAGGFGPSDSCGNPIA